MTTTTARLLALAALGAAALAAGCASSREALRIDEPELDPRLDSTELEGAAHGFPALRSSSGELLAEGDFRQWLEGERLHVRIRYEFLRPAGAGAAGERSIEETAVLRQQPALVQERWSWTETRGGRLERRFAIDFLEGAASAEVRDGDELRTWSKKVDVVPGRAFAGAQWALVLRAHRERLLRGEKVRMQTVGFTPKPRVATLELSYAGREPLAMAGREVEGERYLVHPVVPRIAKLFVDAPDSWLWLTHPPPAAFLRFEGPLAEPDDPRVRIDLLPGGAAGAGPARR